MEFIEKNLSISDCVWRHYGSVDSTNTQSVNFVCAFLNAPAPNDVKPSNGQLIAVLSADEQTAGRGRLNRKWQSVGAVNLAASFILVVERDFYNAYGSWLSSVAGVSVLASLSSAVPTVDAQLKWPNDIYVHGKKLGGILCEVVTSSAHDEFVGIVVGIGLNISDAPDLDGGYQATSLAKICMLGEQGSAQQVRDRLIEEIAQNLQTRVEMFDLQAVRDEVVRSSCTLGEQVVVALPDETRVKGIAQAIDDDAALLVKDDKTSRIRRITVGDVALYRSLERNDA